MNPFTLQGAIDFLTELPSTDKRDFEKMILDKIMRKENRLFDHCKTILESSEDETLQFKAYFGITQFHRRNNNFTMYKKLAEKYSSSFKDYPIHDHVKSLMYKTFQDKDGYLKALNFAENAVKYLGGHTGVLHNYCECVAENLAFFNHVSQEQIDAAFDYIRRIIREDPDYAKFYLTKAKLLVNHKMPSEIKEDHFADSRMCIMDAIDKENSQLDDYALRIQEYKNYLSWIDMLELKKQIYLETENHRREIKERDDKISQSLEGNVEELKELKTSHLQMLAFFTAIISLTVGSITIVSNQQDFLSATFLILAFSGALILANVALSILLGNTSTNKWKFILSAAVGITLIGIGILASVFTG